MKTYTGVGSRNTPGPRCRLMSFVAQYLAQLGWTLRSGGADGADWAFEDGALRVLETRHSPQLEIYLPWAGFGGRHDVPCDRMIDALPNHEVAKLIAKKIHPAKDRLKPSHLNLHGRNAYQILGVELADPSDYVLYYAEPDDKGSVKGGTRTAVELGRLLNIPEINLYDDAVARLLFELVKQRHPDPLKECYRQIHLNKFRAWLKGPI